jgi:hypothetical protein
MQAWDSTPLRALAATTGSLPSAGLKRCVEDTRAIYAALQNARRGNTAECFHEAIATIRAD